tara:strand:+ start:303 stop:692 length:390 start_codon:yes stop_codon:yes gene_type:complete
MDNIINISSERDNQGSPIINIIANKLQPMKDFSPVFIYTLGIVNKSLHISQKEIKTFSIVININCSGVNKKNIHPAFFFSLIKYLKKNYKNIIKQINIINVSNTYKNIFNKIFYLLDNDTKQKIKFINN